MDEFLDDHGRPLFLKAPLWVLRDVFPRLSSRARELYFILLSYSNFKTGTCFPSRRGIAKRWRKSTKTIKAGIDELVEHGLVQVTQYRKNEAPIYTLSTHPDQSRSWSGDRAGNERDPAAAPPDQEYLFKAELTGHAAYVEASRLLEIAKVDRRVATDLLVDHEPEQVVEAARNAFAARDFAAARGDRRFNCAGYLIRALTKSTRPIRKSNLRGKLEDHYETTRRRVRS